MSDQLRPTAPIPDELYVSPSKVWVGPAPTPTLPSVELISKEQPT